MIRIVIVYRLILKYLGYCFKSRVAPWKYFQLNAKYFNREKGIFSKLDMDWVIPENWRLKQFKAEGNAFPDTFPVFFKPEWGQNAYGIRRVDSLKEYQEIRHQLGRNKQLEYIVQEAAWGDSNMKFFIFAIIFKRISFQCYLSLKFAMLLERNFRSIAFKIKIPVIWIVQRIIQ